MADDYHIFVLPESMKLDLMSSDQRRMYTLQKRINEPSQMITQMARLLSDAGRPQGASMTLPEQMGVKR